MRGGSLWRATTAILLCHGATAVDLTIGNTASVKTAASTIAYGLMKFYTGNNTGDVPGNLPDPYYWWEAGAMFGTMVDYWFYTGDTTYNNVTVQAMQHQIGTANDYMPANQTLTEGNDDQGFWAMAAMTAAETNFQNPDSGSPGWLALAQAVFNEYVSRWDTENCNGGLRWQIFSYNNGYNYKNSISNGCFANIAARLARYTGNSTYADWAAKVFQWEMDVGFITSSYQVYDGAGVKNGTCPTPDQLQWTYNAGIFMHSAAVMYNITNGTDQTMWKTRVQGLLDNTAKIFFNNSIMIEQACEASVLCDNDQQSFKGYLSRWLAGTTQMASFTYSTIYPLLTASASAAAKACSGSPSTGFKGTAGTACGFKWTTGAFDGLPGVGEQMNALSVIMYTLVNQVTAPVTANTGGTSEGNVNAGTQSQSSTIDMFTPITTGDRVAAGFVTVGILFSFLGGTTFLMKD